jgi:hypothetical protein
MRPAAGASPGQSIPPSTTPPSPAQVEAARHKQEAINDIMELVRAGRQEEATQLYHQTFKVSLKEAKRTVANLATNERNNAPAKGRLSSFLSGLFGSDND